MDCDGIRRDAYDYIGGAESPPGADAFGKHLEGCPPCATEIGALRSRLSLLHALPDTPVSPEVWKRIQARLPKPRAAGFRMTLRIAAAASLLVALFSFVLVLMRPGPQALPVVLETGATL